VGTSNFCAPQVLDCGCHSRCCPLRHGFLLLPAPQQDRYARLGCNWWYLSLLGRFWVFHSSCLATDSSGGGEGSQVQLAWVGRFPRYSWKDLIWEKWPAPDTHWSNLGVVPQGVWVFWWGGVSQFQLYTCFSEVLEWVIMVFISHWLFSGLASMHPILFFLHRVILPHSPREISLHLLGQKLSSGVVQSAHSWARLCSPEWIIGSFSALCRRGQGHRQQTALL
jgi:hypothetical protein